MGKIKDNILGDIFISSVAGEGTCVFVSSLDLCFDCGMLIPEGVVAARNVFMSHTHTDHVAGIWSHAGNRSLVGLPSATYHVPKDLEGTLRRLHGCMEELDGSSIPMLINGVADGSSWPLTSKRKVLSYKTTHRIPSVGYVLQETKDKLKEEYVGLSGQELVSIKAKNISIVETKTTNLLSYTGDTTFQGIPEQLFNVKTMIMECTYLDDLPSDKAIEKGHVSIQDIINNPEKFEKVETLVLMHFSGRYSTTTIEQTMKTKLPKELLSKTTFICSKQ